MPVLDLTTIWTAILGVGVFLYVALDGFDLGVGMLYGLIHDPEERGLVMNSIAPIWDGNETWLILGAVGLLAAFPVAFAIIIPAVYFPLLLMLLALIFRGVAFEFRYRDQAHRSFWDHGFCYGSLLATFAQGCVLGSFIQGFQVEGRHYVGGSWDWLTPFSVLTGAALVFGYALLGAGWLNLKTEGSVQAWARQAARVSLVGVAVAIGLVSVWTPLMDPAVAARWFAWPNLAVLAPVPLLTVALGWALWRALAGPREMAPFLYGLAIFLMAYLGIVISLWPMIVPRSFTLQQAAASENTQAFLLVGTLVLLPVVLLYTAWSYWVFRGKVKADIGYH